MMTEQRLQEIEAQHQRGLLHRADIDDLIVEARRLKQEMVKCQDIWSTTIAEGMESITELQQQRDAALAERDALREQVTCGEHERMALVVVADAIRDDRTEARRVLREASGWLEPEISRGPADSRWVQMMRDVAAVLAQDESAD